MKIRAICVLAAVLSTVVCVDVVAGSTGYWRFEAGPANTAATQIPSSDSAGQTGTAFGGPTYSGDVMAGTIGATGAANAYSLALRSGQALQYASQFIFNAPGDATIEFWMKRSSSGVQAVLWGRGNCDDTNRFQFYVNPDGTFAFDYRSPAGALHTIFGDPAGIPAGGIPLVNPFSWTHIAIARHGNTYTLYQNGALLTTADDVAPDLPTASGWSISGRCGYDYVGLIDEVRISSSALAPDQLLWWQTYTPPVVDSSGYWRFEAGPANTGATDIASTSLAGPAGYAAGGPLYRSDVGVSRVPATGTPNALSLELQVGQAVTYASVFPLNLPGDGTVEFWLKRQTVGIQAVIWGRGDCDDTNRFQFYLNPDDTFAFDYRSPSGELHTIFGDPYGIPSGGVPLADPFGWNHVAIARHGNTYTLYQNGVMTANAVDANADLPTSFGWSISGRCDFDYGGLIDELRLSSSALTAVQLLYSAPAVATNAGIAVVPVTVVSPEASITFADVIDSGATTVQPLPLSSVAVALPGQFEITGAVAYEVSTTATVTPPIQLCFNASSITDEATFNTLAVLHGENGVWTDRTISRDFKTGTICASVSSLSPFAVGRRKPYVVAPLYDTTKAFKSGSTAPIKLQIFEATGANVSASTLGVKAVDVVQRATEASSVVVDAGNSNPDLSFRYDDALKGYIFNLNTKGLSGTYDVRFRIGADGRLYSTSLQVR